jgi:uncharacterized membrane protein YgdD (TMEM256/DUF423 family)
MYQFFPNLTRQLPKCPNDDFIDAMNISMTNISFLRIGALVGALAVAIGAFGAHGLKPHLSDYQITIFEKGVQYQFYHAFALLAVGLLLSQSPGNKWLQRAGWLFVAGIIGFSGSLYLLACRDLLAFPVGWAGPVTPLGGLCFLAAWSMLAMGSSLK